MLELIDFKKAMVASDFNANDSGNHPVKLSDYRGKKNIVLIFNRGFFDRIVADIWSSCFKIIKNTWKAMQK
jgi:peroxiredoxin